MNTRSMVSSGWQKLYCYFLYTAIVYVFSCYIMLLPAQNDLIKKELQADTTISDVTQNAGNDTLKKDFTYSTGAVSILENALKQSPDLDGLQERATAFKKYDNQKKGAIWKGAVIGLTVGIILPVMAGLSYDDCYGGGLYCRENGFLLASGIGGISGLTIGTTIGIFNHTSRKRLKYRYIAFQD